MNDTTPQPQSAGEALQQAFLPNNPWADRNLDLKEVYERSAQAVLQWHQGQHRDVPSVEELVELYYSRASFVANGFTPRAGMDAVRSAILAALPLTQAEVERLKHERDVARDEFIRAMAHLESSQLELGDTERKLAASEQASLAKVEEMRLQLRISEQARAGAEAQRVMAEREVRDVVKINKDRQNELIAMRADLAESNRQLTMRTESVNLYSAELRKVRVQLVASREEKGWIACSERMPTKEDGDKVLWRFNDNSMYAFMWNHEDISKHHINNLTHWMQIPPLPSAPEPFDPEWNCPTHFVAGDPTCPACIAKQPKPLPTPPPDPLEEVKPQTEKWFLTNPPTLEEKWAKEKAAYAEGKVIQWRYRSPRESEGVDWSDCPNPKWINSPGDEYRIAPTPEPAWTLPEPAPERVALSAEDVPPGSAIKNGRYRNGEWAIVIEVELKGVSINNRTEEIISWRELMEHFEILRPGSTTWEPCGKSKPAAQAKEGAV